jgi:glycogen operon protein
MGTLLLSGGIPMITSGDERLKTQGGNNNAYCQDNITSWLNWDQDEHRDAFFETVRHLISLRKKYASLRPDQFTRLQQCDEIHDQMLWYSKRGDEMSIDDWHDSQNRVLQRLSYSKRGGMEIEGLLLVINGTEIDETVIVPDLPNGSSLRLIWDSALELPPRHELLLHSGFHLKMPPTSIQLFEVN